MRFVMSVLHESAVTQVEMEVVLHTLKTMLHGDASGFYLRVRKTIGDAVHRGCLYLVLESPRRIHTGRRSEQYGSQKEKNMKLLLLLLSTLAPTKLQSFDVYCGGVRCPAKRGLRADARRTRALRVRRVLQAIRCRCSGSLEVDPQRRRVNEELYTH